MTDVTQTWQSHMTNVTEKDTNDKEWHLVGNTHKASPKRVLKQSNNTGMAPSSPSRFHLLSEVEDDVEEGVVEASSAEEVEAESSEADVAKKMPKEDPKPQQNINTKNEKQKNKAAEIQ